MIRDRRFFSTRLLIDQVEPLPRELVGLETLVKAIGNVYVYVPVPVPS